MKLIDKSALAVEIENRIKKLQNLYKEEEEKLDSIKKISILLCIDECKVILSLLNTLEAKEVDLEKEIKDYLRKQPIVARSNGTDFQLVPSPEKIAKHFFELGQLSNKK